MWCYSIGARTSTDYDKADIGGGVLAACLVRVQLDERHIYWALRVMGMKTHFHCV
jgi:hypothetical protein